MGRKTGSHAEITGPRIRAAAQRLFARYGYAAVSMRQIAAEVGVQAGALYAYTRDKQALLAEMMLAHMEELLAARSAEPRPEDPLHALERFCRFHIRYHMERPDELFISYMELRSLEPGHFARIEALRRRYEGELAEILMRGAAQGAFRLDDARIGARAIIAMLNGINTWYRAGGRFDAEQIATIYWNMVRAMVGGNISDFQHAGLATGAPRG